MEGIQLNSIYSCEVSYHIQTKRANSAQMQLGRGDFVQASMFVLTVANRVTIATHLPSSSALLWMLASCFVLCIADSRATS